AQFDSLPHSHEHLHRNFDPDPDSDRYGFLHADQYGGSAHVHSHKNDNSIFDAVQYGCSLHLTLHENGDTHGLFDPQQHRSSPDFHPDLHGFPYRDRLGYFLFDPDPKRHADFDRDLYPLAHGDFSAHLHLDPHRDTHFYRDFDLYRFGDAFRDPFRHAH